MLAKPNPNMEEALRILRLIPANAMAFNHFQTEIYTGSEDLLALTLQWIKVVCIHTDSILSVGSTINVADSEGVFDLSACG